MNNTEIKELAEPLDTKDRHVWLEGKWYRVKGEWGEYRDDHCALCKCIKQFHRVSKNGEATLLVHKRGEEFFNFEPMCWGKREPV